MGEAYLVSIAYSMRGTGSHTISIPFLGLSISEEIAPASIKGYDVAGHTLSDSKGMFTLKKGAKKKEKRKRKKKEKEKKLSFFSKTKQKNQKHSYAALKASLTSLRSAGSHPRKPFNSTPGR